MPLPLRCPRCARRLQEHLSLAYGGAVRCPACLGMFYLIFVHSHSMAFAIDVTSPEMQAMRGEALTLPQVLARLGATYPTLATTEPV